MLEKTYVGWGGGWMRKRACLQTLNSFDSFCVILEVYEFLILLHNLAVCAINKNVLKCH